MKTTKKNMFLLLVKHAIKNTWKWLIISNALIIGIVTLASLFSKLLIHMKTSNFAIQMLTVVMVSTIVAAYIGAIVLLISVIVQNCYKSVFSDEGYLTFTLPISTNQLLISRIVVNLMYAFFTFVCIFLSIIIAELLFEVNILQFIYDIISILFVRPLLFVNVIVETIVYIIMYSYIILFALSIANSAFKQKNRIGLAILFYFIINAILSTLQSAVMFLSFGFGYNVGGELVFSFGLIGKVQGAYVINFTRFIFNALIVVGLHFATKYFLQKKLEL